MKTLTTAALSLCLAFGAVAAHAADTMGKDNMAKDSMSKDSMSKDGMSKGGMAKDGICLLYTSDAADE